jgi:hypothetical protein
MRDSHGLDCKVSKHTQAKSDVESHLSHRKRVVSAHQGGLLGCLAHFFFGFGKTDVGPHVHCPPNVPVFVPILATLTVTLQMLLRQDDTLKEKRD